MTRAPGSSPGTADVALAADWLHNATALIARDITERTWKSQPDLAERFGEDAKKRCLEDAHHHLGHLEAAVRAGSPQLFLAYVEWANALLSGLGMDPQDLRRNLEDLRDVVQATAPEPVVAVLVAPVVAAISEFPGMRTSAPHELDRQSPHAALAHAYLQALLAGERHEAITMVVDAAADGVPVKELYLDVFAAVQRELGRLWQANEINVATEHYCTAATQLAISQLYPRIFSSRRVGRTVVGTCVQGDSHELGIRIVTDFFEMAGWDTRYLGANTPHRFVLEVVAETDADLVAVSATLDRHVADVASLVAALRADPRTSRVPVIVGGHPFEVDQNLWQRVGADGFGLTPDDAVKRGAELVDGRK